MKKIISFFLAAVMIISLSACQQSTTTTDETTSTIANGGTTVSKNGDGTISTDGENNGKSGSKKGDDAINNRSTISGTVGGTTTQKGWSSTDSKYTAKQRDVLYPLRKNVKGKVRLFTPFPDDEDFINAVTNYKKSYPDVTDVEVIGVSNLSRNEKLLSLVNAGQSPDYVYSTYQDYPLRAAKGLTIPIDNYIYNHPGQSDALMNNNCCYNGKRYCVIMENTILVLYYNTALFQRKGEKTPDTYLESGDWTWATLRKLAKKMTDSKNGIYGFATDKDWYFPLCKGEDVIKFVNGKPKINLKGNQNYIDGHQFFADMINVDKSTFPRHWSAHTEFAKGTIAMCFTSADHHTFFDDAKMTTYDYTLFPRENKNADFYSPVAGVNGGFSIAKGSKNVLGGVAFGEYYLNTVLSTKGNQTRYPKAYDLSQKYNVKKIVPWFYGYGLEKAYLQDFCGWVRTGTRDINTLIEENVPIFEEIMKQYE